MRRMKNSRHRFQPAERKRMIIDTAVKLIAVRGWWKTTLTDIANCCPVNTSIGTLGYYFPNRKALALEILKDSRVPDQIKEDVRSATI